MVLPVPIKQHARLIVLILLIFTFAATRVTAIPHIPPQTPGSVFLEKAEAAIYAGPVGKNTERVLTNLERSLQYVKTIEDPSLAAYWSARAALLKGMLYNQQNAKRKAERALEEGLALVGQTLAGDPYSEGLRVRSDLHAQMVFPRGGFYMMRKGQEALDSALHAIQLAPTNVRAHISLAGYYLNAPRIAGGSPQKAAQILEHTLRLRPTQNESFVLHVMLTQTRVKLKEVPAARQAFEKAAAIFPTSPWLADLRKTSKF